MKKIRWFFITLFVLSGALFCFLETSTAQLFIQKALFQSLEQAGIQVEAERFVGYFPAQIELKKVKIQNRFLIDSVLVKVSLLSLLKKDLKIKGVAKANLPSEEPVELIFEVKGNLQHYKGKFKLFASDSIIEGKLQKREGEGVFFKELNGTYADLKLEAVASLTPDYQLSKAAFILSGNQLAATGEISNKEAHLQGEGTFQFSSFNTKWQGTYKEGLAEGVITGEGKIQKEPCSLKARFNYQQSTQTLLLDQMNLQSTSFETLASATLTQWKNLSLQIEQSRYKELQVDQAYLNTTYNGPFELKAEGVLREAFDWNAAGSWEWEKGDFSLALEEMKGSLLSHPISLQKPTFIQINSGKFSCEEWAVSIGEKGDLLFKTSPNDLSLRVHQFPLELLSLNALQTPVHGSLDLEASLDKKKGGARGEIHNLQVGDQKQSASGNFAANLEDGILQTSLDLITPTRPLCNLTATLPLDISSSSWKISFPLEKPAHGHLSMDTDLEEVLDFFDLGTHRIQGRLKCDLKLTNSLGNPSVEGSCSLLNGTYENYLTGTYLCGIQAQIVADKDRFEIHSLTAKTGDLTSSGYLFLERTKGFPFALDLKFTKLPIAELDLVTAMATGELSIRGNLHKAKATGTVAITEAKLSIPDKIAPPLPELQVVYKNEMIVPSLKAKSQPYPIELHLNVTTPEPIFVGGKGLSSEWKGDLFLGGTYPSIAAKGKLELLSGEFVFAGRSFKLIDGSLAFSGKEKQMPLLDLSANTFEKGISITARLQGPLNQPQVTFQSTPSLSLSSILSYLLFGQDIAEIDGFQAIQLASAAASLAGETPDVLESTRKSLGIDRLRILSTPGSAEEGDRVAIQVGKYVAEGVIVSFSQGADESSSNISIEVDLKHGFVLQAETDQQQEQGKFTLKWNRNY